MAGKVIISLDDKHQARIESQLHGQDLYEAYVALTAHIATQLNKQDDITKMSVQAALDALNMLSS